MPIISVIIGEGRAIEKKRGLIRALTAAAVDSFDVRPDQVRVVLNEVPLDHYAVAGTTFAEKAEAESDNPETASPVGVVS